MPYRTVRCDIYVTRANEVNQWHVLIPLFRKNTQRFKYAFLFHMDYETINIINTWVYFRLWVYMSFTSTTHVVIPFLVICDVKRADFYSVTESKSVHSTNSSVIESQCTTERLSCQTAENTVSWIVITVNGSGEDCTTIWFRSGLADFIDSHHQSRDSGEARRLELHCTASHCLTSCQPPFLSPFSTTIIVIFV